MLDDLDSIIGYRNEDQRFLPKLSDSCVRNTRTVIPVKAGIQEKT